MEKDFSRREPEKPIDRIYVDYNSEVHRGQIIAELDKTNLLSKLASAQSNRCHRVTGHWRSV